MHELEQIVVLFVAAVVLAAAARRVGAPYPVFLALGGALLAFLPGAPSLTVPPELALALFVAPVLLDAAYDTSLRDLKDNWAPVTALVLVAVALTTVAVALVAHALVPAMPWAAAIALGAMVAPPDAVAATAVLRQVRPPQRLVTILEGGSLLNDATALLVYRVAVGAAAMNTFSFAGVAPTFLLAVVGSVAAGMALGWLIVRVVRRVEHVPTSVILQFCSTYGVWLLAEGIGLSGVLTTVCCAMTVARTGGADMPARLRIPSYAVWDTVVFALNVLAFIFIGLQIRPILERLEPAARGPYLAVAASVGTGLVISWAGMRGIVTLAAALALPEGFPYRDLILLAASAVVLGTLVIHGLTLKPLLRWLELRDDDYVGREVAAARERAVRAGLESIAEDRSPAAERIRETFRARLGAWETGAPGARLAPVEPMARGLRAARQALLAMRDNEEIGDDAFHRLEQELDWLEMAAGRPDE